VACAFAPVAGALGYKLRPEGLGATLKPKRKSRFLVVRPEADSSE